MKFPFHLKLIGMLILAATFSMMAMQANEWLSSSGFFKTDFTCTGIKFVDQKNYYSNLVTEKVPCEGGNDDHYSPQLHYGAKHIALIVWEYIICLTGLLGSITWLSYKEFGKGSKQ